MIDVQEQAAMDLKAHWERIYRTNLARYSVGALRDEFGPAFRLVESVREEHVTPSGAKQAFVYCVCQVESAM